VQVASLPAAAAAAASAGGARRRCGPTSPRPLGRTVNYSPACRMPVTFAGSAADRRRLPARSGRESDDDGGDGGGSGQRV